MYNPESIHRLQYSTRSNNYKIFKEYSEIINSASVRLCTAGGVVARTSSGWRRAA